MKHGALAILSGLSILFFACGADGVDYQPVSHAAFLQTHAYAVGQRRLELRDPRRNRPLKTEIWYPAEDTTRPNITLEYPFHLPPTSQGADLVPGPHPLVLLSHGTGGNRISQMWLACELAAAGYVVAAVDHFGNTLDNKIPENFVKIWDRPMDISFILDHLLTHPEFGPEIDTAKIGMAGFSLGGYTAIALAGGIIDYNFLKAYSETKEGRPEFVLPELGDISTLITPEIIEAGERQSKDLKDDRIMAFVAMAPALGQGFRRESQLAGIDAPLLIIGAANDERTPVGTNARHYHRLIEGAEYLELEGATGHYVFMNVAKRPLQRNAPVVFKDDASVDRSAVHRRVSRIVLDFFERKLNRVR